MSARYVTAAGLAVVLAAAAVLSFDALRGLALAVAIPSHLAWLLPLAVDAGAAVSCAVWLGVRTAPEVARFAGRMTWCLLAVTVGGNAAQLGMHAHTIAPPWWVAVLVGTIPPAVAGATVHLLVLLVRRDQAADVDDELRVDEVGAVLEVDDRIDWWTDAPPAPAGPVDRAAELIAEGAGRRRLARELGIPEHRARALIAAHRDAPTEAGVAA
ncbi:DUF2637 domain-containing protein [Pseudonocardia hydrocarbonoxydans]|uniref:DUF2637 domain-containing protein n=1 Tax=Pseudonocardia hydrocarbonoxydans TaxID=76726 RepID=A0A4Y3WW56_9PSEU|nr:DUF2637 domain-containing protein [Pseudonocardia hydrocarbonoxydans]GEC22798.1 hypothetical protein PHY01_50810 [Pseudonocardia hydrocarbonoxydans]